MNSKQQNRECQGTLVSQVQSRACQPFGALLDLIISGQDERTLATDHEPNTNTTTTYADSWDRRTDRLDTEDQGKEKQTGTKAAGIGFQRNPRSADHKNASFSSSFSTSSWLFSLATSMGVFPSKFWRVLRARGGGGGWSVKRRGNYCILQWRAVSLPGCHQLTQQPRTWAGAQRTPYGHSQRQSEGRCSCSCPEGQPSPLPQEESEHISPETETPSEAKVNSKA